MGSLRSIRTERAVEKRDEPYQHLLNNLKPCLLWDQGILKLDPDITYLDYHKWICDRQYWPFPFLGKDVDYNAAIRETVRLIEWRYYEKTACFIEQGFIDTTGIDYSQYHQYVVWHMSVWTSLREFPWFYRFEEGSMWDFTYTITPADIRLVLTFLSGRA
jgi:hypothetical protein